MNRGKRQTRKRAATSKPTSTIKTSIESEMKTPEEQPPADGAASNEAVSSSEATPKKSKKADKGEEVETASSTETVSKKSRKPKKTDDDEEVEAASSTGAVPKKSKKPKKADEAEPSTSSEKAAAPKPANRSILQLKVTIEGITPPIWRRIQVLNNDNFHDLKLNINEAMGWLSNRSHQFIVYDPKKDSNILIVDGTLDGVCYDFAKDRGRLFKEQTTKLSKHFTAPGDFVMYEFDLGDSWMHRIVVEKILPPPPPKAEYPKCTGGKRACPPEDCGGVDGYQHLLEVYKNPQHQEYEELISGWLEDMYPGFDPEKFDRKKVFRKVWMWVGPNDPRF